MKTLTLLLIALIFNLNLSACNNLIQNTEENHVINVLKDFYTAYINERTKMPEDFKKINTLLKKYCTDNLQKQLQDEDIDYDLFLDGQNCEKEWLKTIIISKDKIRSNVYIVNFDYKVNGKKKRKEIKIEIVQKGEIVLMDKVLL